MTFSFDVHSTYILYGIILSVVNRKYFCKTLLFRRKIHSRRRTRIVVHCDRESQVLARQRIAGRPQQYSDTFFFFFEAYTHGEDSTTVTYNVFIPRVRNLSCTRSPRIRYMTCKSCTSSELCCSCIAIPKIRFHQYGSKSYVNSVGLYSLKKVQFVSQRV